MNPNTHLRRVCLSPEDAFAQGWADGEELGERMPASRIDQMILLHRNHLASPDVQLEEAS